MDYNRTAAVAAGLASACAFAFGTGLEPHWPLARTSPHGTAGSLAYTQAYVLALVQLVSLTRLSGVSFLLMAVPTVLAIATCASVMPRWSPA